jgi:putative transposase
VIVSEGLSAQTACRILGVSESGYYTRRNCSPSARAIRHLWLTDLIHQVHAASRAPTVRDESMPS